MSCLSSDPMAEKTIVILEGDQIGQELLEESLRVLDPAVTGVPALFQRFDLSLGKRRATDNGIVREAAACAQNWKCGNR